MAKLNREHTIQLIRQTRLLNALERPFRTEVAREKNRFIEAQAESYKNNRRMSQDELITHKQNLEQIFKKHYGRTIRVFFGDIQRNFPKEKAWFTENKRDMFSLIMGEWISTEGAKKVTETAQTTFNDVRNILVVAVENSEPAPKIIQAMLAARSLSSWRAATIARTEVHNAAMYASKRTAETLSGDAGIKVKKRWIPALDERTRTSHAAMVSHPAISMDGKFNVGGEKLDRPADPRGSARNIINCRCILGYEPQD